MAENTYVGPADPEKKFFSGQSPMSGGVFVAIGLALLAVVLAIVGINMASGAETHAGSVEKVVTKLGEAHDALVQKVKDNKEWMVVQLATKATATTVDDAIATLTAKADKSVVDKLNEELKTKASSSTVTRLASDLLQKADADAVKKIARRVKKMDKRVDNLISLNKLIEVAPAAPPPPAPAPPPPSPAVKAPSPPPATAPTPPPAKVVPSPATPK